MIALVDCNSFFASCEKVFRPDLQDKPVVVLSNNDGCIVAMSKEVKALNIPRAAPYFTVKTQLEAHNVVVFSSNYALYQSLSNRIMYILNCHAPSTEVYSIDEAFLHLDGVANPLAFCTVLKQKVERWVGVPISIGIGRTKSLAKVAIAQAKQADTHCYLLEIDKEDEVLARLPVQEIWGVGRKKIPQLQGLGIRTIKQFRDANKMYLQNLFSIQAWKIQEELKGNPQFDMEIEVPARKGILSSCSFSRPVRTKEELFRSLAAYATNATQKLLAQHSYASVLSFFIRTSYYKDDYTKHSKTFSFPTPSNFLPEFLRLIRLGLDEIFDANKEYTKAGVCFSGIEKGNHQLDIFGNSSEKQEALVRLQTSLQQKYGKHKFGLLPAIALRDWDMHREYLSPNYTTRWQDLPVVSA